MADGGEEPRGARRFVWGNTRVGAYVTVGTRFLLIVPITDLWIEAHYRETQIGCTKPSDVVPIPFDWSDADATLMRSGMSIETAVAVATPCRASPTERAHRIGCSFHPSPDIVPHPPTALPEHPGLGRAQQPQGAAGLEVSAQPAGRRLVP